MKRFILWDRKDGPNPPRDENGNFLTSGARGVLQEENVYLNVYAIYSGHRRPKDLNVGEHIPNVKYALSGEKGYYDIYCIQDSKEIKS